MSNDILNSPFFNPTPKKEFVKYDEPVRYSDAVVESAPGPEPVKGFTSIIIPAYLLNYSLFHYTGHCIGSVHEHTDKTKTPYEIILVVNGKTVIGYSNPEETMCDKVIFLEKNVGFAAAVNKGIRVAKGEYIVILSNDVLVFNHWLEDFQLDLEQKDLAMACPLYGKPYARAREADHFRQLALEGKPVPIGYTRDFSCVATRKQLFNEIGMLDEEFYLYKEDLDFFNRMDKAGKKYGLTRSVNTFHTIGATTVNMSAEQQKSEQSRKHYEEKYGPSSI